MVKRIGRFVLFFFLAVVVGLLFYCFSGGALCNDLRASRLEKAYASMGLPEGTVRLETASFVGNTSGTGNHTEIWAGMLLASELSADELRLFFNGYEVWEISKDESGNYRYPAYYMEFTMLHGEHAGDGYFVVGSFYDAFTQMDLRGH